MKLNLTITDWSTTKAMNVDFTKYFSTPSKVYPYEKNKNDKITIPNHKLMIKTIIEEFNKTPDEVDGYFNEAEKEILSLHDEEWWSKYQGTFEHKWLEVLKKNHADFRKSYYLDKRPSFIERMEKMRIRGFFEDEPMATDGTIAVWAHVKQDDFKAVAEDARTIECVGAIFTADSDYVGYSDNPNQFIKLATYNNEIHSVRFDETHFVPSKYLKKISPFLNSKSTVNFYTADLKRVHAVIMTCDINNEEVEIAISCELTNSEYVDFKDIGGRI